MTTYTVQARYHAWGLYEGDDLLEEVCDVPPEWLGPVVADLTRRYGVVRPDPVVAQSYFDPPCILVEATR